MKQPGKFFERVYELVAQIPEGAVTTYGLVAMMAGRPLASRQVGTAMRFAPEERNLPCHRVVNRSGALAPEHAFGGKMCQRKLLEEEGVTFLADGRIDLARHLWQGPQPERAFPGLKFAAD